ncbi:hypothetical protein FQR65_LT03187 [Abscondita terminalis]|nr:hypothetical protein FQR65_LT03187 [Abscondita terminalis]
MASLTIFALVILIVSQTTVSFPQFPVEDQFSATVVPRDQSQARQLLGYNKYDGTEVKNSDKQVYYGNNWEQFDVPNNQQYNRNQYYNS